ncbi:hypothetical protein B0O99DRAFT_524292 [Bisporella sp. PMI_857]|nr:hypothetical protein B0O99DRAFT_524292 [Bisporella sp. PMI_857]
MDFLDKLKDKFDDLQTHLGDEPEEVAHHEEEHIHTTTGNRFHSFAPQRTGNSAKWYVDGCSYMWAVSVAIEEARESIWILDWWLSPELYLRRPPSANEDYRVDRMLIAAAERGVKVNIIVYKEVTSVLTLNSDHTKKTLEVHPNIAVFRHPDHMVDGQDLQSQFLSDISKFSLKTFDLAKAPEDGLKSLYGLTGDVVLYWAHHEKLCLVDGNVAFMGGLDLCFGRWDSNSHPIADAHPTDVREGVFPGQDYNNARIYDFSDVSKFDVNKLDRTKSSRMGWSDIAICLSGPLVKDLKAHFVQRWNYVFEEKYNIKNDPRYTRLTLDDTSGGYYQTDGKNTEGGSASISDSRNEPEDESYTGYHFRRRLQQNFYGGGGDSGYNRREDESRYGGSGVSVQLVRSAAKWSNGTDTEHSIVDAYIQIIRDSQHFIYIENQFFITATGDQQHPVKNQIGAAIVERVVRAYQSGEAYRVIVCMPAVPAFAGDLHSDDALGTRAIMEYQYGSICRGEHSIIGAIQKAGIPDAAQYIRFFNLRNYDRLNVNSTMAKVEEDSGVSYGEARREHDDIVGAGYNGEGEGTGATRYQHNQQYEAYEAAGSRREGSKFDTVSGCYMEGGPSIKEVPWSGSHEDEINAFVSEELYIHSKVLIADDRIVICGSANLNDRSQLGYHDSEIAVVIEDSETVDSYMNGQPFRAAKFATQLRRQLFRKHLGLIPFQDWKSPDENFLPINQAQNAYDWGSQSDLAVQDVLSEDFTRLWHETAAVNTEVFVKAFHCVPADNAKTWEEYDEYFGKHFISPDAEGKYTTEEGKYQYGHVVRGEFPGGVEELKEWLDRVRGSLVEMPLRFMEGVDFAKEGMSLNAFTEEIYT